MVLADQCLAPSYKAIAIAILKNDHAMKSLGFSPIKSEWYSAYKRIEISQRPNTSFQLMLFE
jgi:predicted phosphoadenosine phosphosulfate sulfurtransferase